jgi:hypothetical protein
MTGAAYFPGIGSHKETVVERIAELEDRLRQLEDARELEELLARHSINADLNRVDEYLGLYTEDGSMDLTDYGLPQYDGRERMREFILGPASLNARSSLHIAGPTIFYVEGDNATGEGYTIVCTRRQGAAGGAFGGGSSDAPPEIVVSHANYVHWEFVRVNGEWKVASRTVKEIASDTAGDVFRRTRR